MTDSEAITALLHEYTYRLDAGDLDGVAALFHDAELRSSTHDRVRTGTTEARAIYDSVELGPDGTPGTISQSKHSASVRRNCLCSYSIICIT